MFGCNSMLKQSLSKRARRVRARRKPAVSVAVMLPEFLEQRAMMAIGIPLVTVGDASNAADSATGYGAVAEVFQIGQYEVTQGQYAAFLNAVARTDPAGLYNPKMASDAYIAGIRRSGSPGNYTYSTLDGTNGLSTSGKPITYVSWFDAARFANWMANGQPSGPQGSTTTEDGAYTLNGAVSGPAPTRNAINPNTRATPRFFIPSENQWYKAAFYSPQYSGANGPAGYFQYATKIDAQPGNKSSVSSGANYFSGVYAVTQSSTLRTGQNYLSNVGVFRSTSFYGTYDQNGNASEWNDLTGSASDSRGIRGGSWSSTAASLASSGRGTIDPGLENNTTGFRLVSPVPTVTMNVIAGQLPENSTTSGGVKVGVLTTSNATVTSPEFRVFGPDAACFEVRGDSLYLKSGVALDYESKNSYAVTVGLADPVMPSPISVTAAFRLDVTDVNEAPTAVRLLNVVPSLAENISTASRIKVADIVITDPDANLRTNSLTVAGSDAARFEIIDNSLFLRAGVTLNAAVKASYFVTVVAADSSVAGSTAVTASCILQITKAGTVPGVPTNFTATATTWGSVNLKWSPPTTNGGSTITSYRIEYRTATAGSQWSAWQAWTPYTTSTSVTLTGLKTGVIYSFRVRAENANGAGAFTLPSANIQWT